MSKPTLDEILLKQQTDQLATGSLTAEQSRAKAKQAIADFINELIGEYEIKDNNRDNGHDCYQNFCDYCDMNLRDGLREQQRKKAEEWLV